MTEIEWWNFEHDPEKTYIDPRDETPYRRGVQMVAYSSAALLAWLAEVPDRWFPSAYTDENDDTEEFLT